MQFSPLMPYSQFAASSQFYLYGKKHFSQTGYAKHVKAYKPAPCMDESLSGKVFMVTGANSGVGKEICYFLANLKATVYLLCRNVEKANQVRDEIRLEAKNDRIHVLQVDCSLESSVRACWQSFMALHGSSVVRLDGVVCNAGMLLNDKQRTSEGVEMMFACHLLFGSYLLGSLALPFLKACNGRLIFVSAGQMYNAKFPEWDIATSQKGEYNGNLAFVHSKRGQVLLAERWSADHPGVKIVSAHPGWTLTPGIETAYGEQKKHFEPMRTLWQGAEGICWLLVAPAAEIEGGAFYLDRKPQVKHMAGPFFSEGSFTKNSIAEVDVMMVNLDNWANSLRPSTEQLMQSFSELKTSAATPYEILLSPSQMNLGEARAQVLVSAVRLYLEMPNARTASGSPLIGTHRALLKSYPDSFVGSEAVDWLVATGQTLSRSAATVLMDNILNAGAFQHVNNRESTFKDKEMFYTWCDPKQWSAPLSSPRALSASSVTSPRTSSSSTRTASISPRTSNADLSVVVENEVIVKTAESVRGTKERGSGNNTPRQARTRAGLIATAQKLRAAMKEGKNFKNKSLIRDHRSLLQVYPETFLGSEAVAWAVSVGVDGASMSKDSVITLFDDLLTLGAISHSSKSQTFKDADLIYYWQDLNKLAAIQQTAPVPESAKTLADLQLKLIRLHTTIDTRMKNTRAEWESDVLPQMRSQVNQLQNKLTNVMKAISDAKELVARAQFTNLKSIAEGGGESGPDETLLEAEATQLKAQIDEQKQRMHFPEPEGWMVRMGTDGVYIGMKGVSLGTLEGSFALKIGKDLSGGDAENNHQVSLKIQPFTVRVALDSVSVIGEKGSSVPNISKDRLVFNVELEIDAKLYFLTKMKKWRARSFECKVDIQSEGLGLPTPLIKWVSSSFVPGVIKSALLNAFPAELATFINESAAAEVLDVAGQIRLNGIPIHVLDQILNLGGSISTRDLPSFDISQTRRTAINLLATGSGSITDGALQAHLLSKLRRRIGLLGLKKLGLFSINSKWTNLSNLMSYVASIDRYACAEEIEQLIEFWQQVLSSYAAEDELPALSVDALFQQMRRLDRRPIDVLFEVAKLVVSVDVGGALNMVRDILHGALREKLSKSKNSAGEAQAALKIEAMHEAGMASLKSLTGAVSRIKTCAQGQLLGGEQGGNFEFGLQDLFLSVLPNIKIPLSIVNVEPSKMSLSMYAKEGKDGAFVIDVGVPPIEKEEAAASRVVEANSFHDPSFILSVARASQIVPRKEMAPVEEEAKLEGLAKYFPTSQSIVVANLQRSSLRFRLDPAVFAATVAAAAANKGTPVETPDCFVGVFDKGEDDHYSINISATTGMLCDVMVQAVRVAGVPRLIARWIAQTLREERLKQSLASGNEKERKEKESKPLASEIALKSFANDIQSVHLLLSFNMVLEVKCVNGSCIVELGPQRPATALFTNYYFGADIIKNLRNISSAVEKDTNT